MASSPKLLTAKQVVEVLGLSSERTVRSLREAGKLSFVMVAGRYMYRPEAIDRFLDENEVLPCHDQTGDRVLSPSKSEMVFFTSDGPKTGEAKSAVRVRAISQSLKSSSGNGFGNAPENPPAIPAP